MPLTDNRTQLQDCEVAGEVSGDTDATPTGTTNETGLLIEGSNSVDFQVTNAQEHILFDLDAAGATFNIDLSDSTVYIGIKDNLFNTFAGLGAQVCLNDGADGAGGDDIGYNVGGSDALGLPYRRNYNFFKLDVSVVVATPGTVNVDFTAYNGVEANLNHAAILQVGYGSNHLAKAVGTTPNAWFDGIYYIANDSYAATIDGGSVGTPETMADIVGDDETLGAGMFSNPVGTLYYFFAPTEWGESVAAADHHFSATDEQWLWLGDNGGGHSIGAGHFPMRVIGNATDVGSFVISGIVCVNVGTGADFDCSDTAIDTLEIDASFFSALASFGAPSSGGTSRFCTNTTFQSCGLVTHNGASMNGSSVLDSTVAANASALLYNETADPDGEMDDMTFRMGGNAHHAIEFGADIPSEITLRGLDFTGFGSTDNANDSVFHFRDTTGTITVNLIDCTNDGSGFTYRTDGATIDLVIAPVTLTVTTRRTPTDGGAVIPGINVLVTVDDVIGGLPFEDVVTLTQTAGTATAVHTAHGLSTGQKVLIEDADQDEYNGAHTITVTGVNGYTFPVDSGATSPATGTILATAVLIFGRTNVSGVITDTRSYSVDQPFSGFARKKSSSPAFVDGVVTGTVDNATGASITVNMQLDE